MKKLVLNKETVRVLQGPELRLVAGGKIAGPLPDLIAVGAQGGRAAGFQAGRHATNADLLVNSGLCIVTGTCDPCASGFTDIGGLG